MKKRQIGKSDLHVSELGLGCMSLGTNARKAQNIIDYALDSGINYIDTADLYDFGLNEEIVGAALKGKRQDVVLATKVGNRFERGKDNWHWDPSKDYIKEQVKESLSRLKTDYIDLYQLHGGTIEDNIDETIEAFEELVQEGVIRYYGISSIRPNVIQQYVNKSNIISVMMQYSLFDRRPEAEMLDYLSNHKISVLARGPLAKGMLSDYGLQKVTKRKEKGYLDYDFNELVNMIEAFQNKTLPNQKLNSLALQYVLDNPVVASAIFGASSIEQVKANIEYFQSESLNRELYNKLQLISKPINYQKHLMS